MSYTVVIADLHGMSNILDKALEVVDKLSLDSYKLVFTGDYIDRGPNSLGVVSTVKKLVLSGKAVALKGNHEDLMVNAFNQWWEYDPVGSPWWIPNGGDTTLNSYGYEWDALARDALWMKNLPLYYQDNHRMYVHGFADPKQPDPMAFTGETTMWERYDKGEDLGWYGKHVVHGHTPVRKPELLNNRTNLDTGAVFGRSLAVGIFDDGQAGGPVQMLEITGGA